MPSHHADLTKTKIDERPKMGAIDDSDWKFQMTVKNFRNMFNKLLWLWERTVQTSYFIWGYELRLVRLWRKWLHQNVTHFERLHQSNFRHVDCLILVINFTLDVGRRYNLIKIYRIQADNKWQGSTLLLNSLPQGATSRNYCDLIQQS